MKKTFSSKINDFQAKLIPKSQLRKIQGGITDPNDDQDGNGRKKRFPVYSGNQNS